MAEYFQQFLNANPWEGVATKTVLSTREGVGLQISNGVLSLIGPPRELLAQAPLSEVTLSIKGVVKAGSGVVVDFGGHRWMVDFGMVPSRSRAASESSRGKAMLKAFAGAYNIKGRFGDIKVGKQLRDRFVETATSMGAKFEN